MRQFSAPVAALFADSDVELETIFLVRITDASGAIVISTTTHFNNVTLSNGWVYEANALLMSADPPQLSTVVDREQYKLIIADPDFITGSYAESGLIGKLLDVRVGFIDPATGLPMTTLTDTFVVYKGRVDGSNFQIDTKELGECLLQITGTSPILSLDMAKGIYLSRDAVRGRHPADTCCDDIYEGSNTSTSKWGKI
jgi:hypothetical protein